jgi:hypothetical protein
MYISSPIQPDYFQADLIWCDGTFNKPKRRVRAAHGRVVRKNPQVLLYNSLICSALMSAPTFPLISPCWITVEEPQWTETGLQKRGEKGRWWRGIKLKQTVHSHGWLDILCRTSFLKVTSRILNSFLRLIVRVYRA